VEAKSIDRTLEKFHEEVKGTDPLPWLPAIVNSSKRISLLIDSCTHLNLIEERAVKAPGFTITTPSNQHEIRGAGNAPLDIVGEVELEVDLGQEVKFSAPFVVVKTLGVDALLGILTQNREGVELPLVDGKRKVSIIRGSSKVFWDITLPTAEILSSYAILYRQEVAQAVLDVELPKEKQIFVGREEEKGVNFLTRTPPPSKKYSTRPSRKN
jgi:hypothetical protein